MADGIWWIRMPLPFALDHINLWILRDGDGFALVDTGYGVQATWSLWERLFDTLLAGGRVKNVVVTHYHPDHMGSAAWLLARTEAPLWMTLGEFLSAHAAHDDTGGFDRATGFDFFVRNGLDPGRLPPEARAANRYRRGVPDVPTTFRRLIDGDAIAIDGHEWRVVTLFGHAPEHAALWCASKNVLISGDQVLPRITTNVGVWGNQPESNPLALFLGSLGKLAHVAPDALVLPSHDRVFVGVHPRIAQLHEHHARRLDRLLEACGEPVTAHDVIPVLFKRQLDEHQLGFAMGEAIAHLHYLHHAGKLVRQEDASGVRRFQRS